MKQTLITKEKLHAFYLKIKQLRKNSESYSYEEYFSYALELALTSVKEGNHPVGTVIVFRHEGIEYLIGGRNQVFSQKNASLHADKDALQKLEALGQNEQTFDILYKAGTINANDILLKRPAPNKITKTFLVTTLESCAGCYQTILIHNTMGVKISQIWSGIEAPDSGSEYYSRKEKLPENWKKRNEEQKITILTIWNSEAQKIAKEMYNPLEELHKKYHTENTQDTTNILTNLKKLKAKS